MLFSLNLILFKSTLIDDMSHVLVKLEAKEVSDLIIAGKLGNYATEIIKRFPTKRLAFVVQGIDHYLKKQTNDTAKDYRY